MTPQPTAEKHEGTKYTKTRKKNMEEKQQRKGQEIDFFVYFVLFVFFVFSPVGLASLVGGEAVLEPGTWNLCAK